MRICKICNQILQDDDMSCPWCSTHEAVNEILSVEQPPAAGEKAPEAVPEKTAAPVEQMKSRQTADSPEPGRQKKIFKVEKTDRDRVEEAETWLNSLEAPLTEAPLTETPLIETPLTERTQPDGTITFDLIKDKPPRKKRGKADHAATMQFSLDKPEPIPDGQLEDAGLIERQLSMEESGEKPDNRRGLTRFGVSMIAVLVVAVILSAGLLAARYWSGSSADEEFYLDQLKGTWISDTFVYASDEDGSVPIVEHLVIRGDGSFTLSYLLVDPDRPKDYDSWQVLEQMEGTIEIDAEDLSMVMIYEQDGIMVGYRREFVKLEKGDITLREYYDAERKSSYDVHLTRLK